MEQIVGGVVHPWWGNPSPSGDKARQRLLVLAALGVVYGDIGTSPLYALRECFLGANGLPVNPIEILGLLSLLIWSLVLIVSIKYLGFILRADNRGEGGILAIMTLVNRQLEKSGQNPRIFVSIGLFGSALLFADAMITPAISVLSAVEGLNVATSFFEPYVIPISLGVLIVLFLFQSLGTARIGVVFGPIMLVWFLVLGMVGLFSIVQEPRVLFSISPLYAVEFFAENAWLAFVVMGTVFLVFTGAEALYADLGHFGKKPIRQGWFYIVFPALVLNYLGQGAWLLRSEEVPTNLFYRSIPVWGLYPMVALSTVATVIASQAVISGAFSLMRQSVQLGYSPRMTIVQTSARKIGQVYMPGVNGLLMLGTILLVLTFRRSGNLAAAYGVAVSGTMFLTTLFLYEVSRRVWVWDIWKAALLAGVFLSVDFAFFSSNLLKLASGGWVPLLVAGVVYLLATIWRDGRAELRRQLTDRSVPVELFLNDLEISKPIRVPGTAVFLTGNPMGIPSTLLHNFKHNKVLHETIVLLNVRTEEVPHVSPEDRIEMKKQGKGLYRVVLHYGFFESPDIPEALQNIKIEGATFEMMKTSFFLGRESLVTSRTPVSKMSRLKRNVFVFMSRNALDPSKFFGIPPNRVVELGVQLEM
jgi:KUP system potassium uptake protein